LKKTGKKGGGGTGKNLRCPKKGNQQLVDDVKGSYKNTPGREEGNQICEKKKKLSRGPLRLDSIGKGRHFVSVPSVRPSCFPQKQTKTPPPSRSGKAAREFRLGGEKRGETYAVEGEKVGPLPFQTKVSR